MKKISNVVGIFVYVIFLLSLLSYERHFYNYYTYFQIIVFSLILFTFILCFKEKKFRQQFSNLVNKNKIVVLLCFMMLLCSLLSSLRFGVSVSNSFIVLLYTISILFFYFAIPIYFQNNKKFTDNFTDFVIHFISILSLFGVVLFFNDGLLGYSLEYGRSSSVLFDPNFFALIACVPTALVLRKKYGRAHKTILLLIAFLAVVCSGSRGTMLSLGIGIVFYILVKYSNKKIIKKLLLVCLTIIVTLAAITCLEKISFFRIDQGSNNRLEMIEYAVEQMGQSPVFGFGSVADSLMSNGFSNSSTHNSLVDFLFKYGYPCFIIFAALIIKTLFKACKDKRFIDIDCLLVVMTVNMNTILYSFGGVGIASIILTTCLGTICCFGDVANE